MGPGSVQGSEEGIPGWPVAQAKVWFEQNDYAVEEEMEDPRKHGGVKVQLDPLVLRTWGRGCLGLTHDFTWGRNPPLRQGVLQAGHRPGWYNLLFSEEKVLV